MGFASYHLSLLGEFNNILQAKREGKDSSQVTVPVEKQNAHLALRRGSLQVWYYEAHSPCAQGKARVKWPNHTISESHSQIARHTTIQPHLGLIINYYDRPGQHGQSMPIQSYQNDHTALVIAIPYSLHSGVGSVWE